MSDYVPPPPPNQAVTNSPPNYLVFAILTTIFCCLPFGVVAIVFAAQVSSKMAAGDYQGALDSSNKAKTWCWVALIAGILAIVLSIVLSLVGLLPLFFMDSGWESQILTGV